MAKNDCNMLPECKILFQAMGEDITEIKGDVRATRQAVIGNGTPERSLATRMARVETLWKVAGIVLALALATATLYRAFVK